MSFNRPASAQNKVVVIPLGGKKCTSPMENSFTNSIGMTFNLIPAGTFIMGSPEDEPGRFTNETQHQVTEVTNKQWNTLVVDTGFGVNPSLSVPAIGFYEWKHNGSRKQPYFVKMKNGSLFAMAGIWESWQSPKGETVESCAIITTNANTIVAKLHDRMPVILPKNCCGLWLDSARQDFSFPEYMRPYDPFKMTAYPVNSMVNNVKNEGEGCIRKKVLNGSS